MSVVGSLEDLSFPDILQMIHLSRQTGTLVLTGPTGERRVRFRNGLVCGATLGEGGLELEDLLLQKGLVSPSAMVPAHSRLADTGESLASALVAVGAVSQETVERIVREEIRSVLNDLVVLQKGDFRFDLEGTAARDLADLSLIDGLEPGTILGGVSPRALVGVDDSGPQPAARTEGDRPAKVILMTDRAFVRSALKEELTRRGLEVEAVGSASAVLERAGELSRRGGSVGLICDLILPDKHDGVRGGFDLVRTVRNTLPAVRAVVIGEVRDSSAADAARAVGAAGYLPLPELTPAGATSAGEGISRFCIEVSELVGGGKAADTTPAVDHAAIRVGDPLALLGGLIREMRDDGAAEIPLLVLRLAAEYFERGVLFFVQGAEALGSGAFGPESAAGDLAGLEERIRGVRLPLDKVVALNRVVTVRETIIGPLESGAENAPLLEKLGSPVARESALLPLVSGQEVFGVLYGDNAVSGRPFGDLKGLEIFLSQAGMALQNAMLKRRIASISGSDAVPTAEKMSA